MSETAVGGSFGRGLDRMKKIIIISGPNGAGKTTFAREFLPREAECPVFINADLIAAGLSPFEPEKAAFRAGRLLLEEIGNHVRNERSFSFETTLSGKGYARLIPHWRSEGYVVHLVYLWIASPEMAISRVLRRVQHGGHNIPEPVIRRRYAVGLENFKSLYKPLVNQWSFYDNSFERPILLEEAGFS